MTHIIVVAGPTASGKSDFALEKFTNHIIINADAMQLYSDLKILTAAPLQVEEPPHYLYGILEPHQQINVMQWVNLCENLIHSTDETPVIVGGTGFYLQALLYGLDEIPEVPAAIKQEVESWPLEKLYNLDPLIKENLHPNDTQRIKRAASFMLAHNHSMFSYHTKTKNKKYDFELHLLMPEREILRKRIALRCEKMFENFVVDEVGMLYEKIPNLEELPIARVIGVVEILDYIKGKSSLEMAKEKLLFKTNQYAKRQCTWLRGHF